MTCSCNRNKGSEFTDDDDIVETYGGAFDEERNILYHKNRDDDQRNIEDSGSSSEKNICKDMIFVDGNDGDVEACEYEDTLMERVWWLSKPPKIPKQTCVVPARRIQIMKERLSPTINELSLLSEEVKNKGNKRHKIKSDVDYVKLNYFDDGNETSSCETRNVNIIPDCARELEDLL